MDELIEIDMRLQQISQQIAWLGENVRQLMIMECGAGPSGPQAPAGQSGATVQEAAEKETLQVSVDQASCRGCGLCVRMAPRTFQMNPQTGRAVALPNPGDPPSTIRMAAARCPVGAIHIQ